MVCWQGCILFGGARRQYIFLPYAHSRSPKSLQLVPSFTFKVSDLFSLSELAVDFEISAYHFTLVNTMDAYP